MEATLQNTQTGEEPSVVNIQEPGIDEDQKTKEEETVSPEKEGGEDEKKEEEKTSPSPEELLRAKDEEIAELRRLSRQAKREADELRSEIESIKEKLKLVNLEDEEETGEGDTGEKPKEVAEPEYDRTAHYETMLEMMRLNPKYEDVDSVVTQARVEDVIDALAEIYVEEYGGSKRDAANLAEDWIWSLPNPYRYLYDTIKSYHPDYAEGGKKEEKGEGGRKPEPHRAPTSVAALGGGSGSDKTGWTAAQIDALDEDELDKVPEDVYNKYLRGELK